MTIHNPGAAPMIADVRIVKDGISRPTGVTVIGDSAVVLVELQRAVVVPYRPR